MFGIFGWDAWCGAYEMRDFATLKKGWVKPDAFDEVLPFT